MWLVHRGMTAHMGDCCRLEELEMYAASRLLGGSSQCGCLINSVDRSGSLGTTEPDVFVMALTAAQAALAAISFTDS